MKSNLLFPSVFFEEETRNDYLISTKMKQIWGCELDILNEIIKICDRHHIKYFAIGGTLLGVMRHKGYIPWDDDLDIGMLRPDYNRFCEIAAKELPCPYFLQTEATDPGFLLRHAKVRNSNTTAILHSQQEQKFRFNQGIFVDIFPLDYLPDDPTERQSWFDEVYIAWGNVYAHSAKANRCIEDLTEEERSEHAHNAEMYNLRYEQLAAKYAQVDTKEVAILACTIMANCITTNFVWPTQYFDQMVALPFEFINLPTPCDSAELLRIQYGEWQKFVKGNNYHGEVLFDTERSYTEYL